MCLEDFCLNCTWLLADKYFGFTYHHTVMYKTVQQNFYVHNTLVPYITTLSVPGVMYYCHNTSCQVFAACTVVMHLLSLKACNCKTTQPMLFFFSFFPPPPNFFLLHEHWKSWQHDKKWKHITNTAVHQQQFKETTIPQFFSFTNTDSDKRTHLNMHGVKVAETSTHSVLKTHLCVISSILLTW